MKKIYFLVITVFIIIAGNAQDNIIKTTPLGLASGKYNLQYERMLNDYTSVDASVSFLKPYIPNLSYINDMLDDYGFDEIDFGGWGFDASYRMYSKNQTGPRGFYVAPYLRYTRMQFGNKFKLKVPESSETNGDNNKNGIGYARYGFGLKVGAQWVIKDHFTIDWNFGGLGADYHRALVLYEMNGTLSNELIDGFLPAFKMNLAISYVF